MFRNGVATVIFMHRIEASRRKLKHLWENTMSDLPWSALKLMCWGHSPLQSQETSTLLLLQTISPSGWKICDTWSGSQLNYWATHHLQIWSNSFTSRKKLWISFVWYQTDKDYSLPYSFRRNGWTLEMQLSKFPDHNQIDWDLHIPFLLMAYRTADHNSTGCSPSKTMLGREIKSLVDLIFSRPEEEPHQSASDYTHALQ